MSNTGLNEEAWKKLFKKYDEIILSVIAFTRRIHYNEHSVKRNDRIYRRAHAGNQTIKCNHTAGTAI